MVGEPDEMADGELCLYRGEWEEGMGHQWIGVPFEGETSM